MANEEIHSNKEKPHGHPIVEQPQHEDRVEPAAAKMLKEKKHRVCAEQRCRKANTRCCRREDNETKHDDENIGSCSPHKHEIFESCCSR